MATRAPLGRGLASLLSSGGSGGASVRELSVDAVVPNRAQPRKRFDPAPLQDLAATIKSKGIAQPILVRKSGDRFEIIAGERRWRAAKIAGLRTIPAMIRDVNDREALELALIENLQREDLNPIEEAVSFQTLLKDLTQEDLAKRLGRDRTTVANALRLLKLPKEVQDAVAEGKISSGHARAILQFDQPAAQTALYRRIVRDGLSVRAAESVAQRQPKSNSGGRPRTGTASDADLSRALGTKVRVQRSGKRGKIVIEFYSAEEYERLAAMLGRLGR